MAAKKPAKKAAKRATKRSSAKAEEVGEFGSSDDVRTAYISGNSFTAKAVQYVVIDGDAVVEGDIILGSVEDVERGSAVIQDGLRSETASGVLISGSQYRWNNCKIPYDIDSGLTNQGRVTDAIAHWESNTNFEFVLRTAANSSQHPDWVTFRSAGGCSSSIGRRGGQQFVNLAGGCTKGNTIHEIGHVVGLWHEQSREDRDAFVTINWANITVGKSHNFNQHITDGDDVGAYDYGSIMHYPRKAFSKNGLDTITPVNPAATIGQRTALSAGDIAAVNTICPPILTTVKELHKEFIETSKELTFETIKERIAETRKEFVAETIKERIPETRKEFVEGPDTWVETVRPGLGLRGNLGTFRPNIRFNPGALGSEAVPFAMGTAHSGAASGAPQGSQDRTGADEIIAELEQVVAAIEEAEAGNRALSEYYEQLVAALRQLGWT